MPRRRRFPHPAKHECRKYVAEFQLGNGPAKAACSFHLQLRTQQSEFRQGLYHRHLPRRMVSALGRRRCIRAASGPDRSSSPLPQPGQGPPGRLASPGAYREARRRLHAIARGRAEDRRVRHAAEPRPPHQQLRLHRLALEHKTEAKPLSVLVVATAGPRAGKGSRVGTLHQQFGLAVPPPPTSPSPPGRAMRRPGRHPFSCRCRPRGHYRDHARVPGRWPCAPRCRSVASPPSANAATVRPPPALSSR